jgi:hypothetical protein
MVRGDGGIQDSDGPDDFRFRIREQGDRDALPLCEVGENFGRVVGDDDNSQALLTELVGILLQLDELRFAIRSPICGAVEVNRGALGSPDGVEIPHLARLVRGPESGNLLSDCDPG